MLNKHLLFLIISNIFFINCAYHPHPYLDISFKLECTRTELLCLFIEVFEDNAVYEQLLSRRDICVKVKNDDDEFYSYRKYGFFSKEHYIPDRIEIKLEPIRIGSIESSGKLDQMNMNFQITHNCVPKGEENVYCLDFDYFYNGMRNNETFEGSLDDAGVPGPCSNRWMTSNLKMEIDKRNETVIE